MKTSDVSISKNRIAVDFNNQTIQFVCWELEKDHHEDFKLQLTAAFALCSDFDGIERHMKLNGFDCELEDIN